LVKSTINAREGVIAIPEIITSMSPLCRIGMSWVHIKTLTFSSTPRSLARSVAISISEPINAPSASVITQGMTLATPTFKVPLSRISCRLLAIKLELPAVSRIIESRMASLFIYVLLTTE
jgi:hypothetical protein